MVCRHCGLLVYEAVPDVVTRTVRSHGRGNPQTFVAPLRRRFWHNASHDEVVEASKKAGVRPTHRAEV